MLRLLDTMIFRYFHDASVLDRLLALPGLAIATAVRREMHRKWDTTRPEIGRLVETAIAAGKLAVCPMDPANGRETFLYHKYWDLEGFGEGESESMAVAYVRKHTFVSHDLEAARKMTGLGVRVQDWSALVDELFETGLVPASERDSLKRQIQAMMRGR